MFRDGGQGILNSFSLEDLDHNFIFLSIGKMHFHLGSDVTARGIGEQEPQEGEGRLLKSGMWEILRVMKLFYILIVVELT